MNIEVIKNLFWYCLKERDVECFMIIGFKDGELIQIHEHSRGSKYQCKISIMAITDFCKRHKIDSLYIAHNHIYNVKTWAFEVKASEADNKTVSKLITQLNEINVKLKASFIVTKKDVACHLKEIIA